MAEFERHLQHGVSTHLLLVAAVGLPYLAGYVDESTVALVVCLAPLTLVGAITPDVDHPQARPYRLAERYLPFAALITFLGLTVQLRFALRPIAAAAPLDADPGFISGVIVTTGAWAIWWGIRKLLPRLRPPHRTVTHRLSTGVVLSICLASVGVTLLRSSGVTSSFAMRVGMISGSVFLAGFLSHLLADGVVDQYYQSARLALVDESE